MLQRFLLILMAVFGIFAIAWADSTDRRPDVHVGDVWSYRSTDSYTNETTVEYSHRVVKLNDKEITIQLKNKNAPATKLQFFTREWNALDDGSSRFDPFYPSFKFPLSVGAAWTQEYKSTDNHGSWYSSFVRAKVVSLEKVTVPAGTFDAYKIERNIEAHRTGADANSVTAKIVTWYAPSVNKYVRMEKADFANGRERGKSVDELIEFSAGGKTASPAVVGGKASASAAGIWVGTFISNPKNEAYNVVAMVTENRIARIVSRSNGGFSQCNGALNVDSNSLSGTFTAFLRGNKLGTLTLTGTVAKDRTMSGTYVGPGDSGTFHLTYNNIYERPSSLAAIAGTYSSNKGGPATLVIDEKGNITGSFSNSTCGYRGTVSIINSSFNIYAISITPSNCATSITGTGLATLSDGMLELGVSNNDAAYLRGRFPRQ